MKRKEHTPFYFNEEFDQALRECDEARALAKRLEELKKAIDGKTYHNEMFIIAK